MKEPYTYTMPEAFMKDQNVPARWRVWGVINGFLINGKPCWASNDWIATKIGAHKDTVSQAIKELEELKMIKCTRTRRTRMITNEIGINAYLRPVTTPISDRRQHLTNADQNADKNTGSEAAYEIVQDEPKPKPKTKEIPQQVFQVFSEVLGRNPLNWRTNTTQRTSAENLYAERGIDQIRKALETYVDIRGEPFCPQINSPYDLDSKWAKLSSFKKKHYGD